MKKWQTHRLGDLVKAGGGSIQTGPFGSQLHASDYVLDGIPCIMPANLKNNRVDVSGIARISEHDAKRLNRHIVQVGDIVYSRRGDVTQKALITESENGYFCGTGCLLMRPGTKIDPAFLTYYLSTKTYQSWIASQAVGATMPNLNTGILHRVSFCAPDMSEQKRITTALTALDAKIELNNQINEELEGLAKLLYDYWFVQFDFPITAAQAAAMEKPRLEGKPYRASGGKMIYNDALKREIPEGWKAGKFNELLKIFSGFPFKSTGYIADGKYRIITIKNVQSGNLDLSKADTINDLPDNLPSHSRLQVGDILISLTGNVGRTCCVHEENLLLNQRVGLVRSSRQEPGYAYFYLSNPGTLSRLERIATGSAQKNLSPIEAMNLDLDIPPPEITADFEDKIHCAYMLMNKNQTENLELEKLRDWLLPMLMNGQVTVT